MKEYYSKITVLSICSKTKYASVLRGEGNASSNDRYANMELSSKLPEILDKSNFFVYDLERSK